MRGRVATQIVPDTVPPGKYDGIRFVLHTLHRRDIAANPLFPDSLVGYCIVVSRGVFIFPFQPGPTLRFPGG